MTDGVGTFTQEFAANAEKPAPEHLSDVLLRLSRHAGPTITIREIAIALQDRSFGLFHESLCHRGFLMLGSKETLDFSDYSKQFTPVLKHERIYRKL